MLVSANETTVTVHGYCELKPEAIVGLLASGDIRRIKSAAGDFIIAARTGPQIRLISSTYGYTNYFYTLGPKGFGHGTTVDAALVGSGHDFRWNMQAVLDQVYMEHQLDGDTLHADVKRMSAGAVVTYDGMTLVEDTQDLDAVHAADMTPGDPDRLVDIFFAEVMRWAGDCKPVVSLSGGFDSRLILAAFLHAGLKPDIVIMGHENATDRRIASAIAQDLGLATTIVELDGSSYVSDAAEIARVTNGSKTVDNWHTYIYPRQAQLGSQHRIFVGANGEHARTPGLDMGIVALAADLGPSRVLTRKYWDLKNRRRDYLTADDKAFLAPEFAQALAGAMQTVPTRYADLYRQRGILQRLDRYFLLGKRRYFIANGLALYARTVQWVSPFLSKEWVAGVERLPRHWKLDSRWHRYAIGKLCPKLLEYQEPGYFSEMSPTPRRLYWWGADENPVVPYVDYSVLLRSRPMVQLLRDHADDLAGLANPAWVRRVADDFESVGKRPKLFGVLTPLALWRRELRNRGVA